LKPIVEVLMIEAAEVGGDVTRDSGVDGDTDGLASLHNFRTARHRWGASVVLGLRARARAWTRKKKKGKKDGLVHRLPQSLLNTDLEAENQATPRRIAGGFRTLGPEFA
jgi:hypothetical protein